MKKVCLNTERMLDEANPQDDDYNLWKKVYELMNGEDAFVYESCWDEKAKIKATFSLICRIQKHSTGFRYGRKIQ